MRRLDNNTAAAGLKPGDLRTDVWQDDAGGGGLSYSVIPTESWVRHNPKLSPRSRSRVPSYFSYLSYFF